jgi:hypothetical protein
LEVDHGNACTQEFDFHDGKKRTAVRFSSGPGPTFVTKLLNFLGNFPFFVIPPQNL